MSTATIRNAVPADAQAIFELNCAVYETPIHEADTDTGFVPADSLFHHIERFPEGIFVAEVEHELVGFAITMRTSRSPQDHPLSWWDAIGGVELKNHQADGKWLYGVDFGVHPDARKQGIGSAIYRARFALVRRLNLLGFYAGGMLAGYKHHQDLSLEEYGRQVRQRQLVDPTITMQMNQGFRAGEVIKNYCGDMPVHDSAMLIIWDNQDKAQLTFNSN